MKRLLVRLAIALLGSLLLVGSAPTPIVAALDAGAGESSSVPLENADSDVAVGSRSREPRADRSDGALAVAQGILAVPEGVDSRVHPRAPPRH